INYNGCVEKHILENMIYGVDIDRFSAFLTKISLIFEANIIDINFNIYEEDFLIDFLPDCKFDIIIGNPPYIGHKNIEKEYSCILKDNYSEVFYDKADISYCFFKASHNLLNEKGAICFITSRYFLEAKYADKLRSYINDNLTIIKILDYNGQRVFKNAIISPMIILLTYKNYPQEDVKIEKYSQNEDKFMSFSIKQSELNRSGWMLLNTKEQSLYEKIREKCNYKLSDICNIKQGIITGYDKAFVVTDEEILKYNLEKKLLKKWIKNSNITNYGIKYVGLYILYTNLIDDESKYPNTIAYLQKYKDRLSKRRECKNGVRKWYELQWGRDLNLFENNKIVFPYKSKSNNFYYDTDKYLCSADVYSLIINEELTSYDYIVNYLNSSIFEFFFKSNAKKVGEKLYEYYPNKLENMRIFIPKDKNDKILTINNKIYIENYLEKMFNITVEDKYIIKQCIKI
ncbi:MAG TPA: adenine-specific DNA methylase, partial [Clostridiales bacterium]|nr:adenine-specific DNA methylase [Clostridiales bacterium]